MTSSIKFFLIFLIVFGFNLTCFAQQKSSPIKKLSRDADVIVTGKVIGKKSAWNSDKTRIFTKTTVQIDEYLKGNNNYSNIEIISPGGEVDGIGELYSHMPKFTDNEEVLVFLEESTRENTYSVLKGEEGKYTIATGNKTNENITLSKDRLRSLKSEITNSLNNK